MTTVILLGVRNGSRMTNVNRGAPCDYLGVGNGGPMTTVRSLDVRNGSRMTNVNLRRVPCHYLAFGAAVA